MLNGPDDTSDVGILEDDTADLREEAEGPPAELPASEPKRYISSDLCDIVPGVFRRVASRLVT